MPDMKTWTANGVMYDIRDQNSENHIKATGNPHKMTAEDINAPTVTDMNAAIKKAAPQNLLDNSDFRNLVNQRGIPSGTIPAWTYMFDRWTTNGAETTYVVDGSGVTVTGSFIQRIVLGTRIRKLTFAVKINGTVYVCSGVYNNSNAWTRIAGLSIENGAGIIAVDDDTNGIAYVLIQTDAAATVEWAACYEGEYTAENLPEYQPKGYGAELAECQRYYYRIIANWKWLASGICTSATEAIIPIKLPTAMRIKPTVTIPDASLIKVRCGAGTAQKPSAIAWNFANDLFDIIQMESTVSGATTGDVAMLYFDKGGIIQFSADL